MIRPDYFSIDGSTRYPRPAASDASDSVHSDNPSWIDPGSETRYQRRNSGEFWSDSGSDLSDERKLGDSDPKREIVAAAAAKGPAEMEAAGGFGGKSEKSAVGLGEFDLGDLGVKEEFGFSASAKKQVDVGEIQGLGEDSPKFWSVSGGEGLAATKLGEDMRREEVLGVGNDQAAEAERENEAAEDESPAVKAAKPEGDEDKRRTVILAVSSHVSSGAFSLRPPAYTKPIRWRGFAPSLRAALLPHRLTRCWLSPLSWS